MAKFTDALVVTLKGYFNAGDQPTEAQFAALIDAIQEGIEEHQHDTTGDGDGTGFLAGPITLTDGSWIGITAADLRVEFDSTNGDLKLHLGDAAGADEVQVVDSGAAVVFRVDSDGNVTATSGETHLKALITTSGGELTIDAAGAITVTHTSHYVDTFGDAATDDLITISGGVDGQILILRSASSARDTTLKEGGNLWLAGDFTLDSVADRIMLMKTGSSWYEISRADNN